MPDSMGLGQAFKSELTRDLAGAGVGGLLVTVAAHHGVVVGVNPSTLVRGPATTNQACYLWTNETYMRLFLMMCVVRSFYQLSTYS